jgi:fructose-1,6-bisphosphatase/inositol monophosphatase family enzyme
MKRVHREIVRVMEEAALKAGGLLLERYRKNVQVAFKSAREPVSEVDKASEEIIVDHILKAFPDHEIFSEETESGVD